MGSLGGLWPVHLKPQEDELLSSWLVRLAKAHALKFHEFCKIVWPEKYTSMKSIDLSPDDEILQTISEKTSTPYEQVFKTTFKSFEGLVYEKSFPCTYAFWIMPYGRYSWRQNSYGRPCCLNCLAEDNEPYFRKQWRLAFVTVCEKHHRMLLDSCPECGSPVNFIINEAGSEPLTKCKECSSDLLMFTFPVTGYAYELLSAIQHGLLEMIHQKNIYAAGYLIRATLLFNIFHDVIDLLINGKKSTGLRKKMCKYLCLPDVFEFYRNCNNHIEAMSIKERSTLLVIAYWIREILIYGKNGNMQSGVGIVSL